MANKFTILKTRFTQNARIDRDEFAARLSDVGINPDDYMPKVRCLTDALRKAVDKRLVPFSRFFVDGMECKVLVAQAKGVKEFKLDVAVQVRGGKEVTYSPTVCSVSTYEDSAAVYLEGAASTYPDIVTELGTGGGLAVYGKENLFDSDLRRVVDKMLDGYALRIWAGVFVALGPDANARLELVKRVVGNLDDGEIKFSALSLEDSAVNREALADELGETFRERYMDIFNRCYKPGPNLEALSNELVELDAQLYTTQDVIGVEIPVGDAPTEARIALVTMQVNE